jgi:signal transduction histidine kinase
LVDEALRISTASLEQSGIAVVRDFDEAPLAMADRRQTLQIFVNLIRNAKEAIDEANPPERRLSISVRRLDASCVQATFSDTGIGIAGENLTRIFSHGFTTRAHGHGFGLHSAALAAQQMAGRLSAQSAGVGKGATFTLELPVADTQPANT